MATSQDGKRTPLDIDAPEASDRESARGAAESGCAAEPSTPHETSLDKVLDPTDGLAGLRRLMELAPMPMWVSHPNGSCGWFNSTWLDLTGRALEQEQGDRWPSSLHHEDREQVERIYREALAKREVFEVTYRLRRHDGAYRWIRDRGTPRYDANGEFVGYIGTCVDVTEAELTRQELERELADKAKLKEKMLETQRLESLGVLAGGIAHDFNNLLMGIVGSTSMLSEDFGEEPEVLEQLSQIDLAAEQAAQLCKQLLAYSGQRSVKLSRLSLRALIEESVHLWQHTTPKKVSIELDLSPHTPLIKGDEAQLRQVLLNLVTNAWEAILPDEGTVKVKSGHVSLLAPKTGGVIPEELPPGNYAMFQVSDDGAGMEPDKVARIFEPFFSTKFTGRGLGLAAVLGIVRAHDGNIFVRSQPGRGTTFRLLIPSRQRAAAAAGRSDEEHSEVVIKGTALVVDDEEMVRNLVTRMLRRVGFRVQQAADGLEGIEKASTLEPGELQLVVLDVMMPRLDGAEALRSIAAHHPDALTVVMSGYSKGETAEKFEGQSVAAFLEKPFTYHKLRKRLGEVLQSRARVH